MYTAGYMAVAFSHGENITDESAECFIRHCTKGYTIGKSSIPLGKKDDQHT